MEKFPENKKELSLRLVKRQVGTGGFEDLFDFEQAELKLLQRKADWVMSHRPDLKDFSLADNSFYKPEVVENDSKRIVKTEQYFEIPDLQNTYKKEYLEKKDAIAKMVEACVIDRIMSGHCWTKY